MITNTNGVSNSVTSAASGLLESILWLIPNLFIAVLVVLVGWMISVILGKIVEKILNKLQINKASKELGLAQALSDLKINNNISGFIGATVKWFFAIAFFLAAADILKLTQVTDFLNKILLYIPNIIAAVLILAVGILVANILNQIIHKSAKISGFVSPDILGSITKWSILVFAILAALEQLGIAPNLIDRLFTGIVITISLSAGLAFGLGGRDKAKEILDKIGK